MATIVPFLFTGNDVHQVALDTLELDAGNVAMPSGMPPGSMVLKFRQFDPGPVEVRPLLPGTMRFLPDPAAAGVVPNPATDAFDQAAYANWKTVGRIVIVAADRSVVDLNGMAPDLLIKPNRIWYGPVSLPASFLFDTLTVRLKKAVVTTDAGTVRPNNPNWTKHAIAAFLSGKYAPLVQGAATAAQDERLRFTMPTVCVPQGGDIVLAIATALSQDPQDARRAKFDEPVPDLDRDEPLHPSNGLVPAREVYRKLRPHMLAEDNADNVLNAILSDWPNAPRFLPIRFTRTWNPVPNCSATFPRQQVRIQTADGPLTVVIPAHGIVYVRQDPVAGGDPPTELTVQVTVIGGMKWLLGGGTSWQQAGGTTAVEVDLLDADPPHICLRLPMSIAIFSDLNFPRPGGAACTYLSLRRTVRALVDNRIAGGRLNFGVASTSPTTRAIIAAAFQGTPASVGSLAANAPDPAGDPTLGATLEPILQAFFPLDAPQQGAAAPTNYNQGKVAYRLWQSALPEFQQGATKNNFLDAHVGRGAAGSMVSLGLAAYHIDPTRNAGESDADYFDRIVAAMFAGLETGALLQFWNKEADFVKIKARNVLNADPANLQAYGHSPLFRDYTRDGAGNVTAIGIVDQSGPSELGVDTDGAGKRLLKWDDAPQQIWIAANWTE